MLRSQILLFSTLAVRQGAAQGMEETCFPLFVSDSCFLHYPEMVPPQVLQSGVCCCPSVAFPEFHFSGCSWPFHQVRVSRQSVKGGKILHLLIGKFSQHRSGRKTGHKSVLWYASGTAHGRPGVLQWVQNWVTPTLSSVSSSPVPGKNVVFQSPFSLHWSCAPSRWFLLGCELVYGSAGSVCKYIT